MWRRSITFGVLALAAAIPLIAVLVHADSTFSIHRQEINGTKTLSVDPNPQDVTHAHPSKTNQGMHELLGAMDDVKGDSDKLAALFKVGDEHIRDLIKALDDPSKDISLRAQMVIRYLGNPEGMKELTEWYSKQPDGYPIAGPIPIPLTAWDYKFINLNLIGKPSETWGDRGVQYIYALAIDGTRQSRTMLRTVIKGASKVDERTFVGYALKRVRVELPTKVLPSGKDLPKLVLDNAFFVSSQDHKQASARLLGLNGTEDKALVEVYINRGRLAEEWYHVVIKKCEQGWKFFSITLVAVS